MHDAREKTILVSGGSRGLGLEIVGRLLESGARVSTFARRESAGIAGLRERHGEKLLFQVGDLGAPEGFAAIVANTEKRLGRIAGLVNNAGIVGEALIARQKPEEIARLIDVNLRGPLLLTRLAIRSMMIDGGGRVVNVSSIVSVSGYKGTVAYSAAKGGINAMTRALARELGGRGITVNTVAPGYMETALTAKMDPKKLAQIVRRTPLGRAGRVDDVVGVVLFLLSESAGFVSGQTIVVDGGLTA